MGVIGYKGFSKDMCNIHGVPKQYEVGKTYTEKLNPMSHQCGMHFCLYLEDVTRFVRPDIICKVEALGSIEGDGYQYSTNKLKILEIVQDNRKDVKV